MTFLNSILPLILLIVFLVAILVVKNGYTMNTKLETFLSGIQNYGCLGNGVSERFLLDGVFKKKNIQLHSTVTTSKDLGNHFMKNLIPLGSYEQKTSHSTPKHPNDGYSVNMDVYDLYYGKKV